MQLITDSNEVYESVDLMVGKSIYLLVKADQNQRFLAEIEGVHFTKEGDYLNWIQVDEGPGFNELWDEGEVDLDDYGKTWVFTKEEFIDKMKELYNENFNYLLDDEIAQMMGLKF